MAVAWPAGVNQTILDSGYASKRPSTLISSPIEYGPRVTRRRCSVLPKQHTIQLRLRRERLVPSEPSELELFEAFIELSLLGGALNTTFPLPPTFNAAIEVRFVPGDSVYSEVQRFGEYTYVQFVLEEVL
jgi:hypothetical protein